MTIRSENFDYICEKNKCLGCMACFNICAVNAIVLSKDEIGSLTPVIDNSKCISCGQCSKVCPVLNPTNGFVPLCGYAAYSMDDYDKKTCASGGIATAFYREVINQGGMIIGSVVDGIDSPYLKCSDEEGDIEKFKGSKYVYVNPMKVYTEIKDALDNGQKSLFIGTPCQVDGLRHYLKHNYEQLITVDLVCHGTPPVEYLSQYITSILKGKCDVRRFSFRGKYDFRLVIENDNKVVYNRKCDEDYYFTAFLKGLIHREVCYSCPYANQHRVSDITIGDFWGAPNGTLNSYAGKISAVLINTKKGQAFFDDMKSSIVSEIAEVDLIVKGNNQLRLPSVKHSDRELFINQYKKTGSFNDSLNQTSIVKVVNRTRVRNKILAFPRFIKHKVLHI